MTTGTGDTGEFVESIVSTYHPATRDRITRKVLDFTMLLHLKVQQAAKAQGGFTADQNVVPADVDRAYEGLTNTAASPGLFLGLGFSLLIGGLTGVLTVLVVPDSDAKPWFQWAIAGGSFLALVGTGLLGRAWERWRLSR